MSPPAQHGSKARFDELPISSATKRGVAEGFRYEFMTEVQAQTVGPIMEGADVLARAKTGTGKTLGFLIPTVELITAQPPGDRRSIQALVVSPTRELASQIHKDAELLLRFHTGFRAVCVFGGTKITRDQRLLAGGPCSVLIATPGRLIDHLATPGFPERLAGLRMLILDEADRLLDMGFRHAMAKILESLPPASTRQNLLFSATFPAQVSELAGIAMSPGYRQIDTVKPEEESTPEKIAQSYVVMPTENITRFLWGALQTAQGDDPHRFKVVVFFNTARVVGLYADVFRRTELGRELFEIHSKKSQSHRTKESERFRAASRGVLFSSDVSARGLDYPGVTTVIQVGAASSTDQYVHRLGRTGRAGKSGAGLMILHDFEEPFLKHLQDMPLQRKDPSEVASSRPAPKTLFGPASKLAMLRAYVSWLGYYLGKRRVFGLDTGGLVKEAHRFAASIYALEPDGKPPPIRKKVAGKMGLKGAAGLNVVETLPAEYA